MACGGYNAWLLYCHGYKIILAVYQKIGGYSQRKFVHSYNIFNHPIGQIKFQAGGFSQKGNFLIGQIREFLNYL